MARFVKTPTGYFLSNTATVVGAVTVGAGSSFWFGAVARGDVAPITLGRNVNVQDGSVIHCDTNEPNVIEDDVSIGHRAVVHGLRVGRASLIGMGAVVLGRTEIGCECLIAAGAVVPPGLKVPDRMVVMGVPGRIVRPINEKELKYIAWLSKHYAELAQRYMTDPALA